MPYITLSDGSAWPRPALESDPEYGLGHRLRYGTPTRADILEAAAIINAYGHLVVEASRDRRNFVCREIRAALRREVESQL